jgi:GNAT superfamily N-acetyltransferase
MNIHAIESASLKAWPALEELTYDGWILRFSGGYTKRANSVNTFRGSTSNLDETVSHCERLYQESQLPTIFRITSCSSPEVLDPFLQNRGYIKVDPTSVLTLNLGDHYIQATQRGKLQPLDLELWLKIFCNFRGDSLDDHQIHKNILNAMPNPKICASLEFEDQSVACGVGSLINGYFGLFDLFTEPSQRKKGFGTSLVLKLLNWSIERGAKLAYLQVVKKNRVARSLYEQLGFSEAYTYWYRVMNQD